MPQITPVRTRQRPVAKQIRSRLAFARRPVPRSEAAAAAFLTDVLVGETPWSVREVQNLLALHTMVAIGRWHAQGLDDVCLGADS
jgi:hypothetical protein